MSRKKVLIISFNLPPFNNPQSIQIGRLLYYLKKENEKLGNIIDIYIVTGDMINAKKDTSLYPDFWEGFHNVIKIRYRSYGIIDIIKSRFLIYKLPDIYIKWHKVAFKELVKKYPQRKFFDLIITFSYPASTNLLGMWLKEYYQSKWIAHHSDPWSDNPYMRYRGLSLIYNKVLEKKSFMSADKHIFVSDEMKQYYTLKYPDLESKFYVLYHSFDDNLFKYKRFNKLLNFRDYKVVRYIGSFYGIRTPEPFFKALLEIPEEIRSRLKIEIIGGGLKLPIFIRKYKLDNYVRVINHVNYVDSLNYMSQADLLLLIDGALDDSNRAKFGQYIFFPSKLVDYIGSGTLILGITPKGTSFKILSELGYPCFEPHEISKISSWLIDYLKGKYEYIPPINYKELIDRFNIAYNIKKFIDYILE